MRDYIPTLAALGAFALLTIAPVSAPLEADQVEVEESIDIELEGATLRETLQSFATITGARLEMAPEIEGRVSIKARKTPWPRILDQICKEQKLYCETAPGETATLHVSKSTSDGAGPPGYAAAVSLSLRGADLTEVLRSFATVAGVEARLGDGVEGEVSLEVQSMPWPRLVKEICRLEGCRVAWREDGFDVTPAGPSEAPETVDMELAGAPLEEVLRSFGAVFRPFGGTEIEVDLGGVSNAVTVDLRDVTWQQALDQICQAAGCRWTMKYGQPLVLRLEPQGRESAETAALGISHGQAAAPPRVSYRLTPPGGPSVEGTAAFTWAAPHHVVAAPGGAVELRLVWLSFHPGLQVILPVIRSCSPREGAATALTPAILPLGEKKFRTAHGSRVEIAPALPGNAITSSADATCGNRAAGVRVTIQGRPAAGKGPSPQRRLLIEESLLITPIDGHRPVAAIVDLGAGPGGQRSLVLLRPESEDGVVSEILTLAAGQSTTRSIGAPDALVDLHFETLDAD